jgi:hypothetical protein
MQEFLHLVHCFLAPVFGSGSTCHEQKSVSSIKMRAMNLTLLSRSLYTYKIVRLPHEKRSKQNLSVAHAA